MRATTLALKAALPEGLALRGLPFALRGKVWLSERRAAIGIPHIVARVFGKSPSGKSRAQTGNSGNFGVKSHGARKHYARPQVGSRFLYCSMSAVSM